jgi:hypothetical protein
VKDIVYKAFFGDAPGSTGYRDGNPGNCSAENLYVTTKFDEGALHCRRRGYDGYSFAPAPYSRYASNAAGEVVDVLSGNIMKGRMMNKQTLSVTIKLDNDTETNVSMRRMVYMCHNNVNECPRLTHADGDNANYTPSNIVQYVPQPVRRPDEKSLTFTRIEGEKWYKVIADTPLKGLCVSDRARLMNDGKLYRTHEHKSGDKRFKYNRVEFSVHVVMALVFVGPQPTPEHTVDHINRDHTDNRAVNLRWATKEEQYANRTTSRLCIRTNPALGEKIEYPTMTAACSQNGVSKSQMTRNCKSGLERGGYIWSSVPVPTMFVPEGVYPPALINIAIPVDV